MPVNPSFWILSAVSVFNMLVWLDPDTFLAETKQMMEALLEVVIYTFQLTPLRIHLHE